jgi:hypothetical protein
MTMSRLHIHDVKKIVVGKPMIIGKDTPYESSTTELLIVCEGGLRFNITMFSDNLDGVPMEQNNNCHLSHSAVP